MWAWLGSKLLPWGLLLVAIAAAAIWIKMLQKDVALYAEKYSTVVEELSEAVAANKESQNTITTLQLERIRDREATLAAQERQASRNKNLEAAKKEMRNAPEANAAAGRYFDALGDSLRGLNPQRGHEDDN